MTEIGRRFQCGYKYFNKLDINNNPNGFLEITVLDKTSRNPITFAEVSVYLLNVTGLYAESGEGILIARYLTDEEGKIPRIELPVIDGGPSSRAQYYMLVRHFRYYPVNVMNIMIYPNITTSYTILLTPLTESSPDYEFIFTPEIHRN